MAKIPPIDLTPILDLLKKEGPGEITKATKTGTFGAISGVRRVLGEWNKLLGEVETIVKMLAKGGDLSAFVPHVTQLLKSAGALSALASQVLSFIPGPIGIVCSLLNAILCFCRGDIIGGFLELLGCIPGGKAATKGVAKFAPQIEKILLRIVSNSPELTKILKEAKKVQTAIGHFMEKVKPQGKSMDVKPVTPSPKTPTQLTPQRTPMTNNPNSVFDKHVGGDLTLGKTMTQGQLKQNRDLYYGTRNYYLNNPNPLHPYY